MYFNNGFIKNIHPVFFILNIINNQHMILIKIYTAYIVVEILWISFCLVSGTSTHKNSFKT